MAVVAVGINERDVSLDVFEQSAISERDLPKALQVLCDSEHISEAVVLSTCLRTEVYAVVERFHDGLADIERFFRSCSSAMGTDSAVLSELLSCWVDDAAVSHLFEVAAGIDSPVLGEGEILRQVRTAADLARQGARCRAGRSGRCSVTRSRPESACAPRPRSRRGRRRFAHAAVALAADHLEGGLAGRTVLVIGAGEMGAGFSKALAQPAAPARVVVANRSRRAGGRPGRGESGARGGEPGQAGRGARAGRHRAHLDGRGRRACSTWPDQPDDAVASRTAPAGRRRRRPP